ncbi:small GTP-binding protein [Tritrichomonas foetus]|uniref:Small GTP-binding protein n=1 Tax=Tritrichomonas foetus TaxID=1144522 RepID=A0A1J4JDQ7_9EUKA|nr:small GTP-binding protein [Tritrichomonas foetus]|eukprot:OHS95388.1 small GTP-binding protein [Tritrichomonas foetus]
MYSLVSGIIHEIVDRSISKSSLLVLGIDGAGKTTLIDKIMQLAIPNRRPKTIMQTLGLNTDNINEGKISLRIWDLGGKKDFRGIWYKYMPNATALIYVVNGKQEDRIHESRKLFDEITCSFTNSIVLVFLEADESILNLFPSADRAEKIFFIDITKDEEIRLLYNWMKSTAKK